MKRWLLLLAASRALAAQPDSGGSVTIEAHTTPPAVTPLFSATADETIQLGRDVVIADARVRVSVVHGSPDAVALGVDGKGEVLAVTGTGLESWAVRHRAGERGGRSEVVLRLDPAVRMRGCDVTIRIREPLVRLPEELALPLLTPGDALGFSAKVHLQPAAAIKWTSLEARGIDALVLAGKPAGNEFAYQGDASLTGRVALAGSAANGIELKQSRITGELRSGPDAGMELHLLAQAEIHQAGSRLPLLSGDVALSGAVAGDGWHCELEPGGAGGDGFVLVGDRAGPVAIDLPFIARVTDRGGWNEIRFHVTTGAVVPVQLGGFPAQVVFRDSEPVVPAAAPHSLWQGFLPVSGDGGLAWRQSAKTVEAAAFFTSTERTELRIGAGRLQQTSDLTVRLLQGRLTELTVGLEGPGDVIGVEGPKVLGWRIRTVPSGRELEVQFSRPLEGESTLAISAQSDLGSWPARTGPLRLVPRGAIRHSGLLRVSNSGAVRLDVTAESGVMQLASDQFDGRTPPADARQVLVYRFPTGDYRLEITASQVRPEIDVSAVLTYRVAAATRGIDAELELDVREAPLREWSMRIPADYTVVAATGLGVGDYAVESAASHGTRILRWLFDRETQGRALLQLRLERSLPAQAGAWDLPPLEFPGVRTLRGQVGVICAGGFRIEAARGQGLAEMPVSFFSRQETGLQQAWRIRDAGWNAAVTLQALAQSVQAEVFHLYSVREGVVHGSVLINYFVVGAPATEWRVAVPAALGNVDVVAQSARREWRREGGELVVPLHQPVLGASTLLVSFDEPMNGRGGTLSPGEVRPLGVQAERGYLEIVSPLQLQTSLRRSDGNLLPLEPEELPAELRLLANAPVIAAYQYTGRPFGLELAVAPLPAVALVDEVVEYAHLASRISIDGQAATDARLVVKTRGQPVLRLALPAGASLWDVRVGGSAVTPRSDGDGLVIPLEPRANPNQASVVDVRYGQPAQGTGRSVVLATPVILGAPIVAGDWSVRGDPDRRLAPRGGDLPPARPPLTETGFEWIGARGTASSLVILMLGTAGLWWWRRGGDRAAGVVVCSLGMVIAGAQAFSANLLRRPNEAAIVYDAVLVAPGRAVTVVIANTRLVEAMTVPWGVACIVVGAILAGAAGFRRDRRLGAAGSALIGAGLLAQHAGAVLFFGAMALAGAVGTACLAAVLWRDGRLKKRAEANPGLGGSPLLAPVVVGALLVLAGAHVCAETAAAPLEGLVAEAVTQHWSVREGRARAEVELRVRGRAGESLEFLRAPAALTAFDSPDLRADREEDRGYRVTALRDGVMTARLRYEMPAVAERPLPVPTLTAARETLTIELDQTGWDVGCAAAAAILPLSGNRSGATLVLEPGRPATVEWHPRRRDPAAEEPRFRADSADLFVPGPGGVTGYSRITVRPVQGRIGKLLLRVPPNLTVGEVTGTGVGGWTFNPTARELSVALEPAQTQSFTVNVETQLGRSALPYALQLQPLRVMGAASDTGTLALAFAGDAQPEGVAAQGLFPVDLADFPFARPGATLQSAWRYAAADAGLRLQVAPVSPEVRASGREVVSLSDDRLLVEGELHATITRAGVFRLSLELPDALDVESLSGPALSQWTEAADHGRRLALLELNGRVAGEQTFRYTLVGQAPKLAGEWTVPAVRLREADRQTGELLIVPDKGLGLHSIALEQAQAVDPREWGGLQPGTVAFQLLDRNWAVRLGIERLQPWITVEALEEWTLREGQSLARIALHYRVENAAVHRLRVELPGLDEAAARTVRASGAAVNEIARVPGSPDLWEIRLSRGVAGEGDARIEFQANGPGKGGRRALPPVRFPEAQQRVRYLTVRSGGRLDVSSAEPPAGWSQIDWSAVPAALRDPGNRSVPALGFRVGDDDAPLIVVAARHEAAQELKLRVTAARLTTLLSATGAEGTVVELEAMVADKSRLGLRLPAGARLTGVWLNGEAMAVAREGEWDRFQVNPAGAQSGRATIRVAYLRPEPDAGAIRLEAPRFGVPLENVTWTVSVPAGYALAGQSGGLRLERVAMAGFRGLDAVRADAAAAQAAEQDAAKSLLERAGALLQAGDQQRAGEMLVHVSHSLALDPAANEDARVELRQLRTDQAMLGLNTVHQRLYLGNQGAAFRNAQQDQAARINPFLQGGVNFNPRQMDQLLMGNSLEENSELRGIAGRLVDQQLGGEPSAGAVDLALPEQGEVLTFARDLEVDGDTPLRLRLALRASAGATGWTVAACVAAILLMAVPLALPARRGL